MYKGLSAPFIHRPIATTLIMVAVLLVGLVAFPSLPVAPLPQVDFPTITVSASLPGASPDTMATSVAQPLERPAEPADLPQGQPVRHAHPHPVRSVGRRADHRRGRRGGECPRPASEPDLWRLSRAHRRPGDASHTRPD